MAKTHLLNPSEYARGKTYCGYDPSRVTIVSQVGEATCKICTKSGEFEQKPKPEPLTEKLEWANIYRWWELQRPFHGRLFVPEEVDGNSPITEDAQPFHLYDRNYGTGFWSSRHGRGWWDTHNHASLEATAQALLSLDESEDLTDEQLVEKEAAILLTAWAQSKSGRNARVPDWPVSINIFRFGDACARAIHPYPWMSQMTELLPYVPGYLKQPKPANLSQLLYLAWSAIATNMAMFKLVRIKHTRSR